MIDENAPKHVHGPGCLAGAEPLVRCLECLLLFEAGISDSSGPTSQRCPQCGLENTEDADLTDNSEFVIRHSSRFR